MGDIAEMMLDGTLCERCGEYIGDPVGYPRYCEGCISEDEPEEKPLTGEAEINGHKVKIAPDDRECSCPDFMYRRRAKGEDCKHLRELEKRLKEENE